MPDVRMPDGTVIRNVPANASRDDIMLRYQRARQAGAVPDKRPTSFWNGVGEEIARISQRASDFTDAIDPTSHAANALLNLVGYDAKAAKQKNHQKVNDVYARSQYRGSDAGKAVGGFIGSLPTMLIPGGPVIQGAAAGALMSNSKDVGGMFTDAALGAVGGKLGDMAGKYVIAPIAERIGRTAPARAVANAVSSAFPNVVKKLPAAPAISARDKTMARAMPDVSEIRRNVADAARLKLPYALADSSPEMRALAGSVSRKSSSANALAESTFAPRARGQADRAVDAIDEMLAPVTDIGARAADIKRVAQAESEPFYRAARQQAAPVDEELALMLQRPAARQAMADAYTTAQNRGVSPEKIGFNLNDQGDVILQDAPSFETLQLVKRALDSQVEPARDQITKKLVLDGRPDLQAIDELRKTLNKKLGVLNEDYAAGNAAYAAEMARREALLLGHGTLPKGNIPQRQFDAALGRLSEETLPEAQRGYATALADQVDKTRLSGNPYEAIYGSPLQQKKVEALYPEGADDFARLYDLESHMSKTAWETLGGSPTQRRALADQLFDNNVAGYGQSALNAATGGKWAFARLAMQKLEDTARTRGEKQASEMAPLLFNTDNPGEMLRYLDDLMSKSADMKTRKAAYESASRVFGLPAATGLLAGVNSTGSP